MRISRITYFGIFCVFVVYLSGCTAVKKVAIDRDIRQVIKKSQVFSSQFTGFALYDPGTHEFLTTINADLFFTPASNTKILTAYAYLQQPGDSIPTFLSILRFDTLHLYPMGDPTWLHPDFPHQPVYNQLVKWENLTVEFPSSLPAYGSGWAWDDYHFDFQPARAWMPLYGNTVRIFKEDTLQVKPIFFRDYVNVLRGERPGSLVYREPKFNLFHIWMQEDTSKFERKVPFDYSDELALQLMQDTLPGLVRTSPFPAARPDTLYNQPRLPVLALMMQRSDNFLAEQLLINAARSSGYTNPDAFRRDLLMEWGFMPIGTQWVDGSGLSRYNLMTPRSLVQILERIYEEEEWSTIQALFPTGGQSGTIKDWYGATTPYVFAKTGTLRNNHCLSGYLITRSGKTLIFSLMNNHYTRPVNEVKMEMQRLLEGIREAY